MTMRVFLIFFLRILYVPFAVSQSDALSSHLCLFVGQMQQMVTGYKFSIADYPEFCETALYCCYFFDSDNTSMYPEDEEAIKSLVGAKKPVYIFVGFIKEYEPWGDIFDPKDQAAYDKFMCPLMQKVNDLGVTGIILSIDDLYSGKISDYANKIRAFASKLKTEKSSLKIGLSVNVRYAYDKIIDNSLFDYSALNSMIDMYFVDIVTHLVCTNETLSAGGNTIIKSSDPNASSMDKLVDLVSKSSMEKAKIVAKMRVLVNMPYKDSFTLATYGTYCQSTNPDDICNSCIDNTTTLYNEGVYVKSTFHGLVSAWIDYDDYDNTCGCQKFPATRALFDGFDGKPLTPCAKIDKR